MKVKELQYPVVNPFLFYGKIVKWQFRPSLTSMKNSYAYRFTVFLKTEKKKNINVQDLKQKRLLKLQKKKLSLH